MPTGASWALQVRQQPCCCGRCWHSTRLLLSFINRLVCFLLDNPPSLQVRQHPKLLRQVLTLDKLVAAVLHLILGLSLTVVLCYRCGSTRSCCGRCWPWRLWW